MLDDLILQEAKTILARGGVIIFPTDTIWGIGCDASNKEAVQRIKNIKGRDTQKGFIILASDFENIKHSNPGLITEDFLHKAKQHHEPFSMIYPHFHGVDDGVCGTGNTVAVRVLRQDCFCKRLVQFVGMPIVATSANFSGEASPTSFERIDHSLLMKVDYVVPTSVLRNQIPSTKASCLYKVDPQTGEWQRLR